MQNNKIVCFYHYYELNQNYIENLKHFLILGISDLVDYIIIIAGETCSIELENLPINIKIEYIKNYNYDYGGYCQIISNNYEFYSKYDFYFFINSSVRGPYLPGYLKADRWINIFIDNFDENTGVVGTSINDMPLNDNNLSKFELYNKKYNTKKITLEHVQTTSFCLNKKAFATLIANNFFNENKSLSKDEVIVNYEIRLSQLLIENNLTIKSLIPELASQPASQPVYGDVLYPAKVDGRTLHPYELVFIKTERKIWPASYLKSLTASLLTSMSNYNKRPIFQHNLNKNTTKQTKQFFMYVSHYEEKILQKIKRNIKKVLFRV